MLIENYGIFIGSKIKGSCDVSLANSGGFYRHGLIFSNSDDDILFRITENGIYRTKGSNMEVPNTNNGYVDLTTLQTEPLSEEDINKIFNGE